MFRGKPQEGARKRFDHKPKPFKERAASPRKALQGKSQFIEKIDLVLIRWVIARNGVSNLALGPAIDEIWNCSIHQTADFEIVRVCTENLIGVDAVMESPKLAE